MGGRVLEWVEGWAFTSVEEEEGRTRRVEEERGLPEVLKGQMQAYNQISLGHMDRGELPHPRNFICLEDGLSFGLCSVGTKHVQMVSVLPFLQAC